MENTTNYNLKKPDYTDFADIYDLNDNMDIIDDELANPTGDSADSTTTFTSSDVADGSATAWTNITPMTSGETHKSLFAKLSQAIKNLRYLWKLIGTTDISSIGNGTITNALSVLNANGVKSITRSGTTFTVARNDDTTFTFNQQDNNTWNANTASANGYVTAGSGHNNKVWKTDGNGVPAWRDDANTTYGLASTSANGLLCQLNGSTSSYLRGDGTWQTPPNTNTWRGIQNNLTSTSTTDSLSAAMGKSLKDQIGSLGTIAFSDPFTRFALPGGFYMIFGARIYANIAITSVYGNGYFYNFTCSLNNLVPNQILMIQAIANCNGGAYAVSIATSSKTQFTGFIWAPSIEKNRSVALNVFIICK